MLACSFFLLRGDAFYELWADKGSENIQTLVRSVKSGISIRRLTRNTPRSVVNFLLQQGNDYQDGEENTWIQILNEVPIAPWIFCLISRSS